MNFLLRLFVFSAFVANSVCLKNGTENPSLCLAGLLGWSYDGEKCVQFRYIGCGGKRNHHFLSQAQCEAMCVE